MLRQTGFAAQGVTSAAARQDTRAGSYERTLHTNCRRRQFQDTEAAAKTFETAIIERYRRRETRRGSAIEMYLAGDSGSTVRRTSP